MKIGKIPPSLLEELIFGKIKQSTIKRSEVKVRPAMGEDCAAVDFGGQLCCISTDPITGATEDIGHLAVHINANDVYASGAEPVGIMVTVLLPESAEAHMLKEIMGGIYKAAEEIEIEVLGGHSEVTDAVVRPVVSVTILGKSKRFISSGGAQAGHDLIMTKWAGLEGTSIIANKCSDIILKELGQEVLEQAKNTEVLLSVKKEAQIAADFGAYAMHDVTEGGILGAVYEMAQASGVGVEVYVDKISILPQTQLVCKKLNIDPFKLISSGALIIAAYNGDELVDLLKKNNINAAIIGKFVDVGKRCIFADEIYELQEPEADEIYKV